MSDVFIWIPDDRPPGTFPASIRELRFGDGYRQIAKEGINRAPQKWSLVFDRDQSEIAAIQTFIDAHEGEWFTWTPPGSNAVAGKYIAPTGYTKTPYSGSNERLSVVFEEFKAP